MAKEKTLAVMVLGPESSGNRFLTRLIVQAGCYGDGAMVQRLDNGIPPANGQPIAWLRSVPHGGAFPDLGACFRELRRQGYDVHGVVALRDWLPMVQSQVAQGRTTDTMIAEANIQRAYQHIFSALYQHHVPYVTVTLNSLISRPELTLRWLTEYLGLNMPDDPELVQDVDLKWWDSYTLNTGIVP